MEACLELFEVLFSKICGPYYTEELAQPHKGLKIASLQTCRFFPHDSKAWRARWLPRRHPPTHTQLQTQTDQGWAQSLACRGVSGDTAYRKSLARTSSLSGPGIGCLLPAGLLSSGLFCGMSPTFFNLSHRTDGDQGRQVREWRAGRLNERGAPSHRIQVLRRSQFCSF